MGLKDERSDAHKKKAQEKAKLNRKLDARQQAHKRITAAKERIRFREEQRSTCQHWDRARLLAALKRLVTDKDFEANLKDLPEGELRARLRERLTNHIKDDKREIENLEDQVKKLGRILGNTREDIRSLLRRIKNLTKRIQDAKKGINFSPGDPNWGGSRDIFWNEVVPAAGINPHSTKRSETFGNPDSDHYIGQLLAYAGDFLPSEARAIAIARRLGIGYNGYADDYKSYYITREGVTFRVQIVASNHGTGPHVHVGIERV